MGLDQSLFIVFFIYGLAFFGMGLAMAMESWHASSLAEGACFDSAGRLRLDPRHTRMD